MDRIVDYYFAPQSPWTYLGHAKFADLVTRLDVGVRVKPVDVGAIFAVSGGLPLTQRAQQRQSYRLIELARFSRHLQLPLNLHPQYFPVSGDAASRHIVATVEHDGHDAVMRLTAAIARGVWAEQRDIADAATLDAITATCGLDAGAIRAVAATPAVQAAYRANTDEAIVAEIFGVPTYIPRFGRAQDERFWGQDRLDFLADALHA